MKHIWFQKNSFGWIPITRIGWILTLLYVVANCVFFVIVASSSPSFIETLLRVFPLFMLATAVYVIVCFVTSEAPTWQEDDKTKQK